ncbi:MAG: family 10 glycosylhydrolase [Blastopirellula sp. JB062]
MIRLSAIAAIVLAWLVVGIAPGQAEDSFSLDRLRADRKEAAQRERRVIFNNDGNEPIYLCEDDTPQELLRHRTAPLADTHVDTIFYCTWSSGFGMFTHDTKEGHLFKTKEGLFSKNRIESMLAAGTDPLQVMVDFGKRNDIEIFWSFSMNDTHDAGQSGYGPIMLRANPLKLEHPDWLLGTPKKRPKFGGWSAVDYARPEIRDLTVAYVEEVCRNYDVNGIELDFFRHPVFFKRAAQTGTPCNEEERALMTEMLRRIRTVTEVEGQKRKKPILLTVRVPDSVEYCRDCGLDIENWLSEGWIDMMTVSGYYRLNPWETSVRLGAKYGVPVYPSLDESRVRDKDAKRARMTVEAYRGRALAARQAGMAGLNLFNSFNPHAAIWRELGDTEALAKSDHDYFASIRGVGAAAGGALPHRDYQNVATLNPKAPLTITSGKSQIVSFYAGVDYQKLKTDVAPEITLLLQFDGQPPSDTIVKLNGATLKSSLAEEGSLACSVKPKQLKAGENRVVVSLPGKNASAKWTDLRCKVRFEPKQ